MVMGKRVICATGGKAYAYLKAFCRVEWWESSVYQLYYTSTSILVLHIILF